MEILEQEDISDFPAFSNEIEVHIRNVEMNSDVGEIVCDEDSEELLMKGIDQDQDLLTPPEDCTCTNALTEEFLRDFFSENVQTLSRKSSQGIEVEEVMVVTQPKVIATVSPQVQVHPPKAEEKVELGGFVTAKQELINQAVKENRPVPKIATRQVMQPGLCRKNTKFTSPILEENETSVAKPRSDEVSPSNSNGGGCGDGDRLGGIDEKLIERIKNDVLVKTSDVSWDDIKGLEFAKETIYETIVFPLMRPDLFTGLRAAPKGVLLFGPPGTGKTLIAKCVAKNSNATFFNVTSSTLTSKWIGEGEMLVRALFLYARAQQPSVVFIDEIDALLSKRSENEHESSRRLKTEFLIFLDGCDTLDEKVLIIGATNRPQELDEAARRRFTKRLYIPLPNFEARKDMIHSYLTKIKNNLTNDEISELAEEVEGFSGADCRSWVQEASMQPLREVMKRKMDVQMMANLNEDDIPPLNVDHFRTALKKTRPSVSPEDLQGYLEWDKKFGSGCQ